MKNFLEDLYYKIPYNWRPKTIWYHLKCRVWKHYSTVIPRTLSRYEGVDKDILLPHCMFEILSQFIEKECSPDRIEWHGEHSGKIIPGQVWTHDKEKHPEAIFIRDEMQYLYEWWHNVYLKKIDHTHNTWFKFIKKHTTITEHEEKDDECGLVFVMDEKWDTPQNEIIGNKLFKRAQRKEATLGKDLTLNMQRLCNIHQFMWT